MNSKMENIEQLIFDYHEGNLSDAEKAELLNIIHQNPEYEKDFALWAQTYAHVPNNVPDYGLTSSLLQKAAPAWYSQYGLPIIIGTLGLIVGSIVYFSWFIHKDLIYSPVIKQLVKTPFTKSDSIVKNQVSPYQPAVVQIKKKILKSVNKPVQSEISLKEHIIKDKEFERVIVQEELDEKKRELVSSIKTQADTLPDSLKLLNQTTNKEKMKSKPKRKLPLNLKPSPDFMPVNPNF